MTVIATRNELELLQNFTNVLITGVGAFNVMSALRNISRDTPILNVGYAGSNTLQIGSRHRVGRVGIYHPNVDFEDFEYEIGDGVPCYTSTDFVLHSDRKEPCLYDMELGFILAMGFTNVVAEKVVSDNLSLSEYTEALNG